MPTAALLTPKQKRVLERIRALIGQRGVSPTLDELAASCRVSRSTIRQYLKSLKEKGCIRRGWYRHRSIELVDENTRGMLPVVGRVSAGAPILADENIEEHVDAGGLFEKADFLLDIRGDSMTAAGILDGDLVAVRIQPEVARGEIAVVMVGDEATVKRVFASKRRVRLVAENPTFEPMIFDAASDEVRIVGKVVGVVRRV